VQREPVNGSSERAKHKHSAKHRDRKHRQRDWPEAPTPDPEVAQGKPWLAEHILVKVIDKALRGGMYGIHI
jgi:hypothetical protein